MRVTDRERDCLVRNERLTDINLRIRGLFGALNKCMSREMRKHSDATQAGLFLNVSGSNGIWDGVEAIIILL